jgi:hypothetical protein
VASEGGRGGTPVKDVVVVVDDDEDNEDEDEDEDDEEDRDGEEVEPDEEAKELEGDDVAQGDRGEEKEGCLGAGWLYGVVPEERAANRSSSSRRSLSMRCCVSCSWPMSFLSFFTVRRNSSFMLVLVCFRSLTSSTRNESSDSR